MSEPRRLAPNQLAQLQAIIDAPELPPDRYQLLGRLGRGGMGSVFLVRDLLLDREVALKLLSLPETEGELDRRLEREARVLASLEHPGIVPVHELGRLADGRLYYTMKRVEGRTLAEHCAAERLGLRARVGLLLKLCDALAFAHARAVLHRDLKPEHVMVGSFRAPLVSARGRRVRWPPFAIAPARPTPPTATPMPAPWPPTSPPGWTTRPSPPIASASGSAWPARCAGTASCCCWCWPSSSCGWPCFSGSATKGPRESAEEKGVRRCRRPATGREETCRNRFWGCSWASCSARSMA